MPEPVTLLDLPGFNGLGRVCRRFGVQFTAFGGVVRRYITHIIQENDDIDLFTLAPFLSDLDLVHTGGSDLTPHILRFLQVDVPFAECFRWELKSVEENAPFWQAMQCNGIIPANLMSLSTNAGNGVSDPWNGRRDIEAGTYRYIRNGFYALSPLYQKGRDLEFFSALLYLRLLLESDVAEQTVEQQPGWADAIEVLADAGSQANIAALQENAYLRSRLRYLLKSMAAASASHAILNAIKERSQLGILLKKVDAYCALGSGYPAPEIVRFEDELDLSPKRVIVSSGRISGDLFRLPHYTHAWETGEAATNALNNLLGNQAAEPGAANSRVLGSGQRVLLMSPSLPLQPGISPSSRINETIIEEFIHFAVPLVGDVAKAAREGEEEDLAVVLAVTALGVEKNRSTTFFPLTAACSLKPWALTEDAEGALLTIRTNCGAILEIAHGLFQRWCDTSELELCLLILQWIEA